jgi:hypothetical protein
MKKKFLSKRIFFLLTLSLTSCTSSTTQQAIPGNEKAQAEHNMLKFIYNNGHKLGKENNIKFSTGGMEPGKFKKSRYSANFVSTKTISLEEARIVAAKFLEIFLHAVRNDPDLKNQFSKSSDEEIINNFYLNIYYFINKKKAVQASYISKIVFEYNHISYFTEDHALYDHQIFQESLEDALHYKQEAN